MNKKKWLNKLLVFTVCLMLLLGGCVQSNDTPPNRPAVFSEPVQEREHVYLWRPAYFNHSVKQEVRIQAPAYAMELDTRNAQIAEILLPPDGEHFKEAAFGSGTRVGMEYSVSVGGTQYPFKNAEYVDSSAGTVSTYSRLLESGRYVQRTDIVKMRYDSLEKIIGRLEICAFLDYFVITFDNFSKDKTISQCDASFAIDFGTGFTKNSDGGWVLVNSSGEGYRFIAEDSNVDIAFQNGKIMFTYKNLPLTYLRHNGFGVKVVPVKSGDVAPAAGEIEVAAQQIAPTNGDCPIAYNNKDGVFSIDTKLYGFLGSPAKYAADESSLDQYDIVDFTVRNTSDKPRSVTLQFAKESAGIIGVSALLRTVDDNIPVDIPVQISKNWHIYNQSAGGDWGYASFDDPKIYWSGQYFHAYVTLEVPAGSEVSYQYLAVYARWGGVEAVSHANLSLVGWAGYQAWDQAAYGDYGENVTFGSDHCLGEYFQGDTRALHIYNEEKGQNKKYAWTGNVGGAEFLNYTNRYFEKEPEVAMRTNYKSQGPNLTDVTYFGKSADSNINTYYQVHLARSNDITRVYYKLKYYFNEATTTYSLSFFNYASDTYRMNSFQNYAYGDLSGVIKNQEVKYSQEQYYGGSKQHIEAGPGFWFALYNSSYMAEENANVMFTVRNYNAVINGTTLGKASVNIRRRDQDNRQQPIFELSLPKGVTTVEKGSYVEIDLEMAVLPASASDYYGNSPYLLATKDTFNTAESALFQAAGNNQTAVVTTGTLAGTYPLTIKTAAGGAAEFSLKGGLGYVPVKFTGLDGTGYKLQHFQNGGWIDINQSVHGNDFWQVMRENGAFTLIYNVQSTKGVDYNAVNKYRLIKVA